MLPTPFLVVHILTVYDQLVKINLVMSKVKSNACTGAGIYTKQGRVYILNRGAYV